MATHDEDVAGVRRAAIGGAVIMLALAAWLGGLAITAEPRDCVQLAQELPNNQLPDDCWR